jgi:ADP-ribose pyrophosphatase
MLGYRFWYLETNSLIMNKDENPWKTLSSRDVYSNKWIAVTEHDVINPAGGKGIYGKVHFKNKAIGIVPLDDHGNTWLVGQYRYTLNEYCWEIPEGGGPFEVSPLESAQRELLEETGITAKKWQQIMRIHTSNSVTDEEGFIFLAEDLTFGKSQLEDTEADLILKKLPFAEALEMIMTGKITDALSIAALLKVARLKNL